MLDDYIHNNFDPVTQRKNKNKDKTTSNPKEKKQPKEKSTSKTNKTQNDKKQNKDDHHHHLTDHIKEKIHEFIGHLDHVPEFLKDNPFIHTGYRINFHTPKKVLKSLFMVHNELVNVWTHLAGAIVLIIICIALCFSMTSIDTKNLKTFVHTEIKDLFDPVYERISHFSQFEHTREEIAKLGENTLINLERRLEALTHDIEKVQEDINPEAIGRLLTKLKNQLEGFSLSNVHIDFDKAKLEEIAQDLKNKMNDLQHNVISKIDSADFDWIDIYKYISPNHSSSKTLQEGRHIVPLSRWPIIVFLLSAVFCLSCSAVFHLFYCLGKRANQILLRLDYAGVSILITGSCFPPVVYGFYCQPIYAYVYLTVIGVTSIVVFIVSLSDYIHTEEYRKLKSLMYGCLGVFAAIPMPHLIYLSLTTSEKNDNLDFNPSVPYYLAMGASYLGGLVIYAFKLPERWNPGKFDIVGHSHQIWHICVLLGIIFTYIGSFNNYYTRLEIPCIGCEL